MKRSSLQKLVGGYRGNNEQADANQTPTQNQELVIPDNPWCLTHSCRYWSSPEEGQCEIKLDVSEFEPDPGEDTGPFVILRMRWSGAWESPEEWTIRWVHFLDYLGNELPGYLQRYAPAPEQMLYQLVSALDPKYARYFGPGKLEEWKVVVERERESAAETE